jgi:hypothetical protein
MCFVRISKQTAIISLYSINWLVFITETACLRLNPLIINVHIARTMKTNGRSLAGFEKAMLFRKSGNITYKNFQLRLQKLRHISGG